jgi:hypothetical protein
MAKQTSLFLTKEIINAGQTFTAFGESGIYKTIFTAGNDDSLVKSINVIATVTGAVAPAALTIPMQFAISGANRNEPTAIHPFTTLSIPPMAGSGATPPIDVLSASGSPAYPIDSAGKRYYPVESGAQLVARYMNNLGLNGQITVTVIAENY